MGASGWAYLVPYQSDINTTLHELREAVFKSGDYYTESAFLEMIDEVQVEKYLPPDFFQQFKEALHSLRSEPQRPKPQTIAELLEMNGENGTHSIIDVSGIASTPGFGRAAPLSHQQLMDVFGTDQPTRSMVEQKADELQSLRSRWEATYIIVYADGLPSEIFFTGYSGD